MIWLDILITRWYLMNEKVWGERGTALQVILMDTEVWKPRFRVYKNPPEPDTYCGV